MAKGLLNSDESGSEDGGAQLHSGTDFKVNEDFARKFTHNKKREELRRLEDKLANNSLKRKRSGEDNYSTGSDSDSASRSEDEDDAGELATEALDSEIFATLNAIRSKDPRVYDKETTFYTPIEDGPGEQADQTSAKKDKPMYLRDYHRENLLNGLNDDTKANRETPLTYNQEQEAMKRSIVGEINAAAAGDFANYTSDEDKESGERDDGFLVAKPWKEAKFDPQPLDVENADKDPETFLSNFMAARAWVPSEHVQFQPFESDDDEEDRKAEEFEEAYNFRFEDPARSNEKLVSHARDIAAKYSVRREENNPRKKQRETEREKKEAAKREKAHDKARLRRLKIEEAEEKLRKIKKAAGLRGSSVLSPEDWARFLDDDWTNAKWEEEMGKRFGDAYYAQDDGSSDGNARTSTKKRRKPKKPKWDDDIDIKDLIPDFDEGDLAFELSDEASGEEAEQPSGFDGHFKPSKDHKKDWQAKKKYERRERRVLEQLVEGRLELETALESNPNNPSGFRYRQTSPLSFGLSPRDILMADDSQLNEYVGLKKLAAFRDPNKKMKDQKHLGKKARLRQWRRDTFGDEEGPKGYEKIATEIGPNEPDTKEIADMHDNADVPMESAKKKRRRSKKSKTGKEANA